jgi:hypothetical protein
LLDIPPLIFTPSAAVVVRPKNTEAVLELRIEVRADPDVELEDAYLAISEVESDNLRAVVVNDVSMCKVTRSIEAEVPEVITAPKDRDTGDLGQSRSLPAISVSQDDRPPPLGSEMDSRTPQL